MVPIQGQQNILVVNFFKERWHLVAATFCPPAFTAELVIASGDNAWTMQRTPVLLEMF